MIKVLKYFLLIVVFFEALIIFAPKQRLFNFVLDELNINKINILEYKFKKDYFLMNIKNSKILYDDIEVSQIKNISISSYFFYNEIRFIDIKIDESLNNIVPSYIDDIKFTYSILNPLFVDINIYTKSFKAKGKFDLVNKTLLLNINLSKQIKRKYPNIIKKLDYNKDTKEYTYEYNL